jgi:hypothetical protein
LADDVGDKGGELLLRQIGLRLVRVLRTPRKNSGC